MYARVAKGVKEAGHTRLLQSAVPMRKLRISAISFLNTAPLMWDFVGERIPENRTLETADFEITYTVPSQCAEDLRSGAADIGIIPAITYATIPDLVILHDVAIAARGPVRSIVLVCKKPLKEVRTIAADTSSRTSVALTQVLCEKFWGGKRQLEPMAPELDRMLVRCDAALLIGDPALLVDRSRYRVYDLAEEWMRLTGKPFVFAFWAVRLAALGEIRRDLDLAAVFRESRDHGLKPENAASIARTWAPHVSISEEAVATYLTRNIHYYLDGDCLQGLDLFFRYAAECGVIAAAPSLRFLGAPACQLTK